MYMQHQRQTNTPPQIRGEGMRRDRQTWSGTAGYLVLREGTRVQGGREGGVAWRGVAGEEREEKGERAK